MSVSAVSVLTVSVLAPPAWAEPECQSVSKPGGSTPVFSFCFAEKGDLIDGSVSARNWTENEKAALKRAGEYWAGVLFPGSTEEPAATARFILFTADPAPPSGNFAGPGDLAPNMEPGENAMAGSGYDPDRGNQTYVASALLDGVWVNPDYDGYAAIEGLWKGADYGLNGQMNAKPNNMESIMIHELGHALGILGEDENPGTGSDSEFGRKVSKTSGGLWFYTGNQVVYDGTNANAASAAIKVFNDSRLGGVVTNQGIPMDNASDQARSHFGLRNALMTHRHFRNYATFIEAEMAALKDLGNNINYNIRLRDHFGLSIYGDSKTYNYTGGFNDQWNGADDFTGSYDGAGPNTQAYALGVHIYGTDNTLTISDNMAPGDGAIRADGPGAGGVRVDGWNNTLNINTEVTANGERGVGLLVAYGKNHQITVGGDGGVYAAQGDAVRFDIGVNILDGGQINADGYGDYALYSHYSNPALEVNQEFLEHKEALAGALVEKFDIQGTISGGRAIYISPNSHVQAINIMDGAVIEGAIISDYDDQWGAAGADKNTALNIQATAFEVNGDILGYGAKGLPGRGFIDLTVETGNAAYFAPESQVRVNDFTVQTGAGLIIQPGLGPDYGTIIGSNNFHLETGSRIDFTSDDLGEAPDVLYRFNPLLKLELLQANGVFERENDDYLGTITIGSQTYINGQEYELEWWRGSANSPNNVLVLNLSGTELDFGDEQDIAGGRALTSATAMALEGAGWRQVQKRTRLETGRRDAYNHVVAPSAGEEAPTARLWAELFYSHERGTGGGRYAYRQNTPGAALGAERWLGDDENILGGLAFSLGLPKYRSDLLENDGQMVSLAAYGLFRAPEFLDISLTLGHSWDDYDQSRQFAGDTYGAKYAGRTFRAGTALSRGLNLGEGFSFTPRLAYDFIRLETNDYQERFNDLYALSVGKSRRNLHSFTLEGELDWRSEEGLGLGLRAGWGHLAGDLKGETNSVLQAYEGHVFRAVSQELDRDALETGLWLDAPLGEDMSLSLAYDGLFSRHTQGHSGEMKLNYRF